MCIEALLLRLAVIVASEGSTLRARWSTAKSTDIDLFALKLPGGSRPDSDFELRVGGADWIGAEVRSYWKSFGSICFRDGEKLEPAAFEANQSAPTGTFSSCDFCESAFK